MTPLSELVEAVFEAYRRLLRDVSLSAEYGARLRLRSYQREVAQAIVHSVVAGQGLSFVVIFPRQSGKNELQAQIEAYLLALFSKLDAELVKVSPTWKPQSLNAMRRLERVLARSLLTTSLWQKEQGYIYRVGRARIFFLSGSRTANIVGATASTLLECDEAQDVEIGKWDKDIKPMAASTNATRVFWGTAWTSATLLGRERRAAEEAQVQDGMRRVWVLTAEEVAREVPAYGKFVAEEIRRMGRLHPLVRTQYFSEEIEAEGGMFPERRLALMRGTHPAQETPLRGKMYAFLLDVAGEDEAVGQVSIQSVLPGMEALAGAGKPLYGKLANPWRDATALTVVDLDLSSLGDSAIGAPTYRAVARWQWVGDKHSRLYAQLRAMGENWNPRYWVVDATGVGAGLASFLDKAFPGRVVQVMFNAPVKSRLGWDFLAVVETGRWQEHAVTGGQLGSWQAEFWQQLNYCQMEVLPGPERRMRWGVLDGRQDAEGRLVHDDWVLSAALCAMLDGQEWAAARPRLVIPGRDPLQEMDEGF
jgi:hypothetical protein